MMMYGNGSERGRGVRLVGPGEVGGEGWFGIFYGAGNAKFRFLCGKMVSLPLKHFAGCVLASVRRRTAC